jgi:hypothetical protein
MHYSFNRSAEIKTQKETKNLLQYLSILYSTHCPSEYGYGPCCRMMGTNPEPEFVSFFKEPGNRFSSWRASTTTLFDVPARGWRNRFLGSLNVVRTLCTVKYSIESHQLIKKLIAVCTCTECLQNLYHIHI